MTQRPVDTTPDPRRWQALGVIALVQFMLVLDITVVNVALPHIQGDLHFSRAGLAWVVDGYVLTAGGLLLLGGRLGDLLGRRRMFMAGLLLDFEGAVLGTAALVAIVYGFLAAGNHPWRSVEVLSSLALGGLALFAFVGRERLAADPLVPAGFLRNGTRVSANVACVFFASVFFTVFFLLTLYMQQVERYSTIQTGLAYLPFGIVIGIGIGISSGLITKVGSKALLFTGAMLVTAGVLLLSRITVHGSYAGQVLPGLVVMALGSGLSFAAFGNASMQEVSGQDASLASGVQSTAQQVGGAVGLAVLATLALRHARSAMAHGAAASVASTHGAVLAFRAGAVVSLAGAVIVALAPLARPVPLASPREQEVPIGAEAAEPAPA